VNAGGEALLVVQDLSVVYGKVINALLDVSLRVHRGEIIAILGANGAGKTTLLKAISGLAKAARGSVRFRDREVLGLPAHKIVRLGIAHVPEGRMVVPHFTVKENLLSGGYIIRNRGELKQAIGGVLEVFPILKTRYDQVAATLSGGEQQMLAIARALISHPSLLLLDEPSLGLGPIFVDKVMQMVQKINKESGATVILVEQNAFVALETAHRAYVLENGRITMAGDARTLLENVELKERYLAASCVE